MTEGLKTGYVKNANRGDGLPLKDGYYDHLMNALEYVVQAFWGLSYSLSNEEAALELILKHRDPGEPPDGPWDAPGGARFPLEDPHTGY